MKTLMIVQARMTSSRLPGKVLKTVLGKPLLEYQIERLRKIRNVTEIVIATTINATDQPIIDLCRQLGVATFRGPEDDVLARFYEAATGYRGETIVRVTADCPLIDPQVSEGVIQFFLDQRRQYDYVSNTRRLTFPRGLDTEVFSFKTLEEAYREADRPEDREHVTVFMYRQPERYRIGNVSNTADLSRWRWTVDTAEDFHLIRLILESLYPQKPDFKMADVCGLLEEHPEWRELNAHIEQKKLKLNIKGNEAYLGSDSVAQLSLNDAQVKQEI